MSSRWTSNKSQTASSRRRCGLRARSIASRFTDRSHARPCACAFAQGVAIGVCDTTMIDAYTGKPPRWKILLMRPGFPHRKQREQLPAVSWWRWHSVCAHKNHSSDLILLVNILCRLPRAQNPHSSDAGHVHAEQSNRACSKPTPPAAGRRRFHFLFDVQRDDMRPSLHEQLPSKRGCARSEHRE